MASGVGHPLSINLPADGEPEWAGDRNDVDNAFKDAIEAKVTADALDIQSDIDLQGNSLINVEAVKYTAVSDPGSSRTQYVGTDGNLYYKDGNGQLIQQTKNGVVNSFISGGITGDFQGSSAAVAYTSSAGNFGFTSAPGVYASIETSDHKIHRGASTVYVDLTTSPVQGSTYELRLPSAPPAVVSLMTMDTTGSIAFIGPSYFVTSSIGAARFISGPTSGKVLAGTVPVFNAAGGWTFANDANGTVTADTGMNVGDTLINFKLLFNRVEATAPNAPGSALLKLFYQPQGSTVNQVFETVTSTTGTTLQTMALTGTYGQGIVIPSSGSYTIQFTSATTGSALYGAFLIKQVAR